MILFEEAEQIVRGIPPSPGSGRVTLQSSLHCVLAEDLISGEDMPPFDKSAVDGFACRKSDLGKPLHVNETVAAGTLPSKIVSEGNCSRIMTGAKVPEGADCVIMLEDTGTAGNGQILFSGEYVSSNIIKSASDFHRGDILVPSGTLIKSRHIPVMASAGYTRPLVYKKPTVGIISTGNELVEPGQNPPPGMIRDSNGPQLEARCSEMHIKSENFGIVPDSTGDLERMISLSVSKHKVSLISGGVSVGDFDYVPGIVRELGFTVHFHGMKVKPGKRMLFASSGGRYIFGLPGNPVSTLVQFELLVKPLLMKLQNFEVPVRMEKRILNSACSFKRSGQVVFIPVKTRDDGTIDTIEYHGSAHTSAFTSANGIMKIPAGITTFEKGELVDVRLI